MVQIHGRGVFHLNSTHCAAFTVAWEVSVMMEPPAAIRAVDFNILLQPQSKPAKFPKEELLKGVERA